MGSEPESSRIAAGRSGVDFEWVHRQLSAAVARVCPGWLRPEREDLVQTAMIRLLERLDRGDGETRLNATYVWKTAYSVTPAERLEAMADRERLLWRVEAILPDGSRLQSPTFAVVLAPAAVAD